jgi:hypothetical protein
MLNMLMILTAGVKAANLFFFVPDSQDINHSIFTTASFESLVFVIKDGPHSNGTLFNAPLLATATYVVMFIQGGLTEGEAQYR